MQVLCAKGAFIWSLMYSVHGVQGLANTQHIKQIIAPSLMLLSRRLAFPSPNTIAFCPANFDMCYCRSNLSPIFFFPTTVLLT